MLPIGPQIALGALNGIVVGNAIMPFTLRHSRHRLTATVVSYNLNNFVRCVQKWFRTATPTIHCRTGGGHRLPSNRHGPLHRWFILLSAVGSS